ncbi:MAG: winged helix-turn-helix domain-containing protein [Promethearchaeota archaeon]
MCKLSNLMNDTQKILESLDSVSFMLEIPLATAQKFILEKQGLLTNNPPKSIIGIAKRIHNIQIDTLSVVARSHDLTIFNRFPQYQEKSVWSLLKQKKFFEQWSHGMCMMPIEEFPFYAWRTKFYDENKKHSYWEKWLIANQKVVEDVYDYVEKNGATCGGDFKAPEGEKSQGWWDWKKEKQALEHLFNIGKLMIAFRKGFQRYFDLTERVLPANISHEPMNKEEIPDYLVKTIFSAIGLGNFEEIRQYIVSAAARVFWKNNRKNITAFLDQKVQEGILEQVKIEGIQDTQYILSEYLDDLNKLEDVDFSYMKLITPFDNVIRERKFLQKFWNFDYKLEAYFPASKRKYGYFVTPILDGWQFIGRLEPKAHRKDQLLEIKSIYFEEGYEPTNDSLERLALGIQKFAEFHECEKITIGKVFPTNYKVQIEKHF